MIRPPPRPPLLPNTPLFRPPSGTTGGPRPPPRPRQFRQRPRAPDRDPQEHVAREYEHDHEQGGQRDHRVREDIGQLGILLQARQVRSEEHTSELQSRQYLVCRLLLEKKTYAVFCLSNNPCTYIPPVL